MKQNLKLLIKEAIKEAYIEIKEEKKLQRRIKEKEVAKQLFEQKKKELKRREFISSLTAEDLKLDTICDFVSENNINPGEIKMLYQKYSLIIPKHLRKLMDAHLVPYTLCELY